MLKNQLGRRNITDEQRTVLIGEAYKAQKMAQGGNHGNQYTKAASAQNGHLPKDKTRDVIAKSFGVGTQTVERAENFVDGLNEAETIAPGIKQKVLSGEIKAPKQTIANIRKAPEEKGKHKGNSKLYLKKSEHYKRKNWKLAEKHRNS